jgi:hypothetical protein
MSDVASTALPFHLPSVLEVFLIMAQEGKVKNTPWGSSFKAPPEILHGACACLLCLLSEHVFACWMSSWLITRFHVQVIRLQ